MRSHALAIALVLALTPLARPVAARQAQAVPEAPVRYDDDHLSADFHRGRRQALASTLPSGSVAVVLGGVEGGGAVDDLQGFAQNPYLYYLTGSEEPGAALLLAPDGVNVDGETVREILFVPPRDPAMEMWLGRRFGVEGAEGVLGVEKALEHGRFEEVVGPLVSDAARRVLHLPIPDAVSPRTTLARQIAVLTGAGATGGASHDDETLQASLDRMRMVKDPEELRLLRRAIEITTEAHRQVLAAVESGWTEYEIEALVEYTFHRLGAEEPAFPSIVGSGENTSMLHYESNRRTTMPGDLVVMDVGARYRGYSADVTRTIPVGGRFTEDQRAIYEIVLEAWRAGIEAARPGAAFGAPGQAASRVMARGLARLGLIDDEQDGAGLRRFFPHGTSHYLGIQVHDVGTYGPLGPGQVITVEPGIYIAPAEDVDPRWWNIGVRIEDDVLVTEGDPVVLSDDAPRDPDDIEAAMAGRGTAAGR
ncbi:MAG TPA: aminopeptidase P N-terminal domain-containing protein [Longimicrobiales bacterium]|nr:aminopeptidase P N-terminal domain-containing protein [Longimicrobiales bacterium]